MFDVHTHIINNSYPHILDVGIAEELTNKSKYFSTGLHPKLFDQETIITDFQKVEKLCQLDNCVAIGECGLDITANNNYQTQKIVFEKQIILAKKINKAIIIHCVRAYNDVVSIIKKCNFNGKVIFHAYNANTQTTNQLIKKENFYFSFGNRILFNSKIESSIKLIPKNRIFIETDNDKDADLKAIYDKVSQIKPGFEDNSFIFF